MTDETLTAPAGGDAAPAPAPAGRGARPQRRAGRPPNARHQSAAPKPAAAVTRDEVRPETGRLKRSRRRTEDRFFVDPKMIPPGMSWEWKAETVHGQRQEDHMAQLAENHWKAVQQSKYPHLVCRKDGQILMERPLYLTQDAQREDLGIALDQVRSVASTVGDTPSGTMTRNHPSARKVSGVNANFNLGIPGDDA